MLSNSLSVFAHQSVLQFLTLHDVMCITALKVCSWFKLSHVLMMGVLLAMDIVQHVADKETADKYV
jgi:hypothetical protein